MENVTIGKWSGLDQYRCELCSFDTLKLEQIEEHMRDEHGPTLRNSPILAPDGEPIQVLEPGDSEIWGSARDIEGSG